MKYSIDYRHLNLWATSAPLGVIGLNKYLLIENQVQEEGTL